ncbi:hypothetical protein Tco_1396015 [Tanacetum coccineum]
MGDENPRRTLGDYSRPSHEGYRNTIEVPNGNDLAPLRSDTIRLVQNGCSIHRLRSKDLNQHLKDFLKIVDSIYLNNDPRDFAKPVKAISMPHDVPSASDRHLIELENQVQRMMEAHISQSKPAQVNTIASSCEICSGPMTLNIAWKIPRKLLLITRLHEATEWEASRSLLIKGQEPSTKPPMIGKTNQTLVGNVPKLSRARKGARWTEPRNKEVIKSPTKLLAPKYHEQPSSIMIDEKTPSPRRVYFVNTTTLVKKERESRDTTPREHEGLTSEVDDEVGNNELEKEEEDDLEYFNTFPSMKELEYHKWLLKNPRPP